MADHALLWLESAARYFRDRPTGGEDLAHWANVANAEECERIARILRKQLEALRLHVAYEALPADRGGDQGPKGQAWRRFIEARDAALEVADD